MQTNIIDIVKATRLKYNPVLYHLNGGINVLIEELENTDTEGIFAVMLAPTNSIINVNDRGVRERYTLNVSFCMLMDGVDFDAEKNEAYIAKCKARAFEWLSWLIKTYPNLNISCGNGGRDYLKYDAILTGYSLVVNIEEVHYIAVC